MDEALKTKTGIYLAWPDTDQPVSIYPPKKYETMVTREHTRVGFTESGFAASRRRHTAASVFGDKAVFKPLIIVNDLAALKSVKRDLLKRMRQDFERSGSSQEWFKTQDRERVREIALEVLNKAGVEHSLVE